MSAMSHHAEKVTRNVRQVAIGEKLIMKKHLSQAGVVITVALPMDAFHCFDSPTNNRINDTLPLINVTLVLRKIELMAKYY